MAEVEEAGRGGREARRRPGREATELNSTKIKMNMLSHMQVKA
jgi:hypothetical protein